MYKFACANWFFLTNLMLCEMAFDIEVLQRDYEEEVTICLKVAGYINWYDKN